MHTIFTKIKSNPLFNGIALHDFEKLLHCLTAQTTAYQKDDVIWLSGHRVDCIGLILSGHVKIVKEDINGDISILTELTTSALFGEAFACAGIAHSPVTVQAATDCEILFLDYKRIITSCPAACPFHSRLIANMLQILARKNVLLNQKIEILSKRTTRAKLLSFFDTQRGTSQRFTIPYNREELAHYLCVDRSAMSNELCKMRDEGLIHFRKNEFEILDT